MKGIGRDVYLFEIPDTMGYVRQTQRSKWVDPRAIRYHAFQKRVRTIATKAGVPLDLPKRPAWAAVRVQTYFPGAATYDADGVLKAVLDSMWRSDRRALDVASKSHEDCACKEAYSIVEVTVFKTT